MLFAVRPSVHHHGGGYRHSLRALPGSLQIYELRDVAEELLALLPEDESAAPAVAAALAPLAGVRPHALAVGSPQAAAAWAGAVADFDARLAAVEARVIARLRELLGTSLLPALAAAADTARDARAGEARGSGGDGGGGALGALAELRAWGGLLTRPAVARALLPERRALIKHVRALCCTQLAALHTACALPEVPACSVSFKCSTLSNSIHQTPNTPACRSTPLSSRCSGSWTTSGQPPAPSLPPRTTGTPPASAARRTRRRVAAVLC